MADASFFVRILHTFAVICDAPLSGDEKSALTRYLDEQSKQAGGDDSLAKEWDMGADELRQLRSKLTN